VSIPSKFDALFAAAAPLVRAQRHQRDAPPQPGGRWPLSIILRPSPDLSPKLAGLTNEAAALAGSGHWLTGCQQAAHLTVRALESYRDDVPADDPAVHRYRRAVESAAAACAPVTVRVSGVTLATGSVMACLVPTDDHADRLRDDVLPRALGEDAWLENEYGRRDIWHLTLVHFTGDVTDPEGLIAWVDQRRSKDLGTMTIDTLELVRFRYDDSGPFMRPETVAKAQLAQRR
jgi:hypothetical protein